MLSSVPLFGIATVTSTHWVLLGLLALAAGVLAVLSLPGPVRTRLLPAASCALAVGVLSPALVSPVFSSAGVWPWALALFAAAAAVGGAVTHVVRAALGCVLTTRVEWVCWVVALVLGSSAAALTMSTARLFPAILTCIGAFIIARLLPGYMSSAPLTSERIRVAGTVALPVLITGVAGTGLVALLTPCVIALLSLRVRGPEIRMLYTRSSVVLVHAFSALLPFLVLTAGIAHTT